MNRLTPLKLAITTGLALACGEIASFAATADAAKIVPLPDVADVLRRVVERAKQEMENDANFSSHYSFTRTKKTDTKDPKGELKKSDARTSTHDPLKLPAAPPKPVQPAPVMTESSIKADEAKGRAFEKRDFVMDGEMIKRFNFSVAGRETIDGRPAIVMEFVPASRNLPVKNFKDRFINKAAGRAWVDEAEGTVVRADLKLTEEVTVLGGLVGSVKKCLYSFVRARTPEGWWFTSTVNWHLEGRQLFTRKVMDFEEHKKDVKRVR